jgi:2C-methyl-D-erythritol 2,4-cyclodiphosphate synthase
MEQANTLFDMNERVAEFDPNTFNMDNIDILVEFDAKRFTQQTFNIIQSLSSIITDSGEIGEFDIDCLKITITNLTTYENNLIVNKRHNI